MSSVVRAWVLAQDPELVAAFRAAFCGCHQPCGHLDEAKRALIARWVERTVMRGHVAVVREPSRGKGWDTQAQRQPWEGVVFREVFGQVIAIATPGARGPKRKGAA